jgi:LPS export ABC transporter protein LptC
MGKLRPLVLLLLFLVLIASVIRFETQRREEFRQKSSATEAPEFFLEQSLTTNYTADGKIDYQMNSDYLEYYKFRDTANINQAYFIFYNKDRLPWHSRSDKAVVFNNGEDIQLSGNVKVWQPDRQMEIITESILLSDSRSFAETSDVIHLKSPSGNLKSKGMKADFNTEKLQFFADVSSEYHSNKKDTPPKKIKPKINTPVLKKSKNAT